MAPSTVDFLPLPARGVVSVVGADAVPFLDNLVTNALDDAAVGEARFAALLTPQGKIAFEFFALRTKDGFLLDTPRTAAAELAKRLSIYKLRAKVTIRDESAVMQVAAHFDDEPAGEEWRFRDPRHTGLGWRSLARDSTQRPASDEAMTRYRQRRIDLGIAEGGADYLLGETFPHEANYDRSHGVSFKKGCFVGQEVVARMQNKTVVRRRVVRVDGSAPLSEGAVILHGTGEIGRVGSVDGTRGLAMVRLDRALEARDKGDALTAGDVRVHVDAVELEAYRAAVAARPVIDL